jgi:murE/murF fusion protein
MKLADLIRPLAESGAKEGLVEVTGLAADSRQVQPGFVFFAVPGNKSDGLSFVADAVARGAIAIVSQHRPQTYANDIVHVVVSDVRLSLALAAAAFYPNQPATIVAVTGTSGKTSVAEFTRQIFAKLGHRAASLGTIGLTKPDGSHYGSLTTPDPVSLHKMLHEAAAEGITHLAMEASSHGLDQRRLDGVRLAAAAFTNLSRDHLDYHATLEAYLVAKLRLFTELLQPGQPAVIGADSDIAGQIFSACSKRGLAIISVGARGETLKLLGMREEGLATRVSIAHHGRTYEVRLPFVGAFQIANALVAAGLALSTGEVPERVLAALEHLKGAPGRFELVGIKDRAPVFVDYAHKPDALEKVLQALKPMAARRLLVVFGCGGDRDRGKRPLMGAIAARLANIVIVTDDNPRNENPAQIRAEILAAAPNALEIADRGEAIGRAIGMLEAGDILLIAGKGHESGQIVGPRILPFSDQAVAKAALKAQTIAGGAEPLWSGLGLIGPLQARVSGGLPQAIAGISIDSRSLKPGDLFFAIRGDNSDGHAYVKAAFARGASAAVIDEAHAAALAGAGPLYVVHQVLPALERLAVAARERAKARIIAVTGSVGKTTTKAALHLVLSQCGDTHASAASYNTHWGVPLTLAALPRAARYGVFEIGMNHAGEIRPLTAMVRPHVAIVTTIAAVHLENFASVSAIADAKAEIFTGLVKGGVAMIHRDIAEFEQLQRLAKASPAGHVVTFGETQDCDARLLRVEPHEDGIRVRADILGVPLTYVIGAPGKHIALNSLAVLLAAKAVGVDLEQAAAALARFRPMAGRGERLELSLAAGTLTLLDESYNANPASMRAALSVLGQAHPGPGGRRIAVLGDMLELGPSSPAMHQGLCDALLDNRVDLVFAAGPLMRNLYDSLPESMRGLWGERAADIEAAVLDRVAGGDVVMIKGSLGSRMGPIVAALKGRFAQARRSSQTTEPVGPKL